MKKKILITVGAGASIDFGLPSVSDVDTLFDDCAGHNFPLNSDPQSNLYRYCRDAIQAYYHQNPKSALGKWVNFEEVLYQINLLAPYLSDENRLHGSNALLAPISLPDVLAFGCKQAVDGNVLRSMSSLLLDTLVDHCVDACAQAAVQKSAQIAQLARFLVALSEEFDIGIFTLNYDNVFTQACPALYTGFNSDAGTFEPRSVFRREAWGFIYHLHGSIHFAMTGAGYEPLHGISWVATPTKDHAVHAFGRSGQNSVEGTAYPTSNVVAGYGKTQQMLRQPFRTYFAQVNRLVHEADSLLFLGYGFGDMHLNAAFSEVRDRRRPVVVVDWANDDQDSLPCRNDTWSYQLAKTLHVNVNNMSMPGHCTAASIAEFKRTNEVEESNAPERPLAVWYNGLLAACQNPSKIISHLM
jgi:hypothetical protein